MKPAKQPYMIVRFSLHHVLQVGYDVNYFRGKSLVLYVSYMVMCAG